MLEQLLAAIRHGGTLETGDLAKQLGTTPQMVTAMLEHLQRSGMLQAYQGCDDACAACRLKGQCHPDRRNAARLWQGCTLKP